MNHHDNQEDTHGLGPMTRQRRVNRGEDWVARRTTQRPGYWLTCALGARALGIFEAVSRLLSALFVRHRAQECVGVGRGEGKRGEMGEG